MSEEKAKYRVLRLSHIANQLWPEGSEVEYDGIPGTALEPINDAAKAAKAKAERKGDAATTIIPNGTSNPPVPAGNSNQPGPEGGNGGNGEGDENLAELQLQYEQLFHKKAHPAMKEDTLREKIAEKRTELGQ